VTFVDLTIDEAADRDSMPKMRYDGEKVDMVFVCREEAVPFAGEEQLNVSPTVSLLDCGMTGPDLLIGTTGQGQYYVLWVCNYCVLLLPLLAHTLCDEISQS